MTNCEKIKKMTTEELTKFFTKNGTTNCSMCIYRDRNEGCAGDHTIPCHTDRKLQIKNEAENIKNMTVDEIADFLIEKSPCKNCVFDPSIYCGEKNCKYGIKAWLEKEGT